MIRRRLHALALLTAVALSMVAVAGCGGGGDEDQNAGSTDGESPAASEAAAPDTLPLGPDTATTAVPGSSAPELVTTTVTAGEGQRPSTPRPTTPPTTPRPTPPPTVTTTRAPVPPAAPPVTRPKTPEQAVWCPIAVETWRLVLTIPTLTPADYGQVPVMLEVARRARDTAPAEIRPAMDVILASATVTAEAIVAGQLRPGDVAGTQALVDQKLGAGTYASTEAAFKTAVDYGFRVC